MSNFPFRLLMWISEIDWKGGTLFSSNKDRKDSIRVYNPIIIIFHHDIHLY